MFKLVINEGVVIRESDNKIVAPCQSIDDIDFKEYIDWVNLGNTPIEIYTTTEE